MPNGWSKPRDLAKLAERRAQFEFEIPLDDLPGIPEEFASADEPVQVRLQFGLDSGVAVVDVSLRAVLKPRCQRCLGTMRLEVAADSHVAIVDGEAAAAAVPEEVETFLAHEGHCSLAAVAAEELLLALPIVPRHTAGEPCVAAGVSAVAAMDEPVAPTVASAPEETQRPFADLRALLERGRKS
jgi:uncharacterized protein